MRQEKLIDYKVDEQKIRQVLESNAQSLNTEAADGGLTRDNGSFTVVPGSQGVSINIEESAKNLEKYFSQDWKGAYQSELELVADVVEQR